MSKKIKKNSDSKNKDKLTKEENMSRRSVIKGLAGVGVLGAFGYFLFNRIYSYAILGDFMKMNSIMGDSLVHAVIGTAVIYCCYLLYLDCGN